MYFESCTPISMQKKKFSEIIIHTMNLWRNSAKLTVAAGISAIARRLTSEIKFP
jgi:hypothetical protein